MFIEFGRLGCKHIIYLGVVYVPLAQHEYSIVWGRRCMHTHDILAQAKFSLSFVA